MEKRRPTYDLDTIKGAIGSDESLAMTVRASLDAAALGYDRPQVAEVVQGITRRMFFKSMTTFSDHKVWQDVYHVPSRKMVLYVKFQADIVTEFSVVSFKER